MKLLRSYSSMSQGGGKRRAVPAMFKVECAPKRNVILSRSCLASVACWSKLLRQSFCGLKEGHSVECQLGSVLGVYFVLTSCYSKRVDDGGALNSVSFMVAMAILFLRSGRGVLWACQ